MMRGLWRLLFAAMRRLPRFFGMYFRDSMLWDLQNGTRTHLRVPKADERSNGEKQDGVFYVPSLTSVVRTTLATMRKHWGPDRFHSAQFLDLRCGKGKTLLVYATEFAQTLSLPAVGIEYDQDLVLVAKNNVDRMALGSNRAQVKCDSAVNLEDHVAKSELVAYLCNSFRGETMRKVLTAPGNGGICWSMLIPLNGRCSLTSAPLRLLSTKVATTLTPG